jgi:hypothetical protein
MKTVRAFALPFILLLAAAPLAAQQTGPVTPPPKREVKRIPTEGTPAPPPMPPDEIIRRFAAKEQEFEQAYLRQGFRQTVRVQEFIEQGPSGEYNSSTEVILSPEGKRYEKVVAQPASTLRYTTILPADVDDLHRIPPFPFTPDRLEHYEFTYVGTQPVDELETYLFRVAPKLLERRRYFFEGLIWVDQRDLAIVKTYGRWVSETGSGPPNSPFTLFEVFRENVEGNLWFPSFVRSEETVKLEKGEARIRLTIRSADFHPATPPKN